MREFNATCQDCSTVMNSNTNNLEVCSNCNGHALIQWRIK